MTEPFVFRADEWSTLWCGDVVETLRRLPAESVHCVVTSPPYYGLRDYGIDGQIGLEQSPDEYIERMVDVFREVRRVLRKDGTAWVNMGDSYAGSGKGQPGKDGFQPDASQMDHVKYEGLEADFHNAYHRTTDNVTRPRWPKWDGIKPKDLLGIPWMLAFALRADGWWLRQDIVWCLSGGTRVYARTQKGDMPITVKDLVRLRPDTVQLWNGHKWTRVLGMSETESRDAAIELTLRTGERLSCTPHHEWPTQRGMVRAEQLQAGDVLQITRLPRRTDAYDPEYLPDVEIGWFVGMYLAEGSRSGGTIQIASHTKEVDRLEQLRALARRYGGTCRAHKTSPNGMTVNIESRVLLAVLDTYLAGRTSVDKRLTNACWQRNDWFLRSLLLGYLEGDGHRDEANSRWRVGFRRNYAWEADLRTLCARLGYSLRLNLSRATFNGREFPAHRGEIRIARSDHHNTKEDGEIVKVARSRGRKFWHIGVEDEPHTFALASGVLTCNSKPNPMPESVTDRCTKAHEYVFLLSKSREYFYDADAIREPHRDKNNPSGRNKRSVWEIATQPYVAAHFATYPEALVEPCIKAGTSERGCCPECGAPWERVTEKEAHITGDGRRHIAGGDNSIGQGWKGTPRASLSVTGWQPTCAHDAETVPCTVLDPFGGSGTTAAVAKRLGRRGILVELNPKYCELAVERVGIGMPDRPVEITTKAGESWKQPTLDLAGVEVA